MSKLILRAILLVLIVYGVSTEHQNLAFGAESAGGKSSRELRREKAFCQWALAAQGNISLEEKLLTSGDILKVEDLRAHQVENGKSPSGTKSEIYLITLEGGAKAVFKPERYLWSSWGEVAAYRMAQWLGLEIVPTTVIREIGGKVGSLQLYVENDYFSDQLDWSGRKKLYQEVPQTERDVISAFHYLVGQWDRHIENVIVDLLGKLWSIDNETVMHHSWHRLPGAPFVRHGVFNRGFLKDYNESEFPFERANLIEEPTEEELRGLLDEEFFKPNHKEKTIRRILERAENGKPFAYVIWRGYLWISRDTKSMGAINVSTLPDVVVEKLRRLDYDTLRRILPDVFDNQHILEFLYRRDQILEHYN